MANEIEFEVLGIGEVLKRNRLSVPPNQREYSWYSESQVRELLQDISTAIKNPSQSYFLGTIVITRSPNESLEIADGQQRLATVTMIFAAIRDWYKAKGDTMMVQSMENDFLFTIDRKAKERIPKLTLNLDDNEIFRSTIIEPKHSRGSQSAIRRSHLLIGAAFEEIKSFIENLEKTFGVSYVKDTLNDWADYLQNKANVVMLVVSDAENAFQMFETLNDRGLKTSQADLVKNHLFKVSETRLPEAQKLWSSMKGAVETVSDDEDSGTMDFLRSACCVISGATTKKEVMKKVKEKTTSKSEAIKIMTLFEEMSKDYAAILNPDHQKWNDYDHSLRKYIQAINILGVTQIRPLMLAIAKYFNKKNASASFKKMVSWSVRFLILNIRGGRLDEGYAKLANQIYLGEIKDEKMLSEKAGEIVITDSQFRKSFEEARVGTAKLARYYLRSLENTARKEENPEFIPNDDSVINLEHIMPESPNEKWPHIDYNDIQTHKNRLGNLALIIATKNSDAANLPFNDKKKIYKESSFLLTSQIAELSVWDISAIDSRQKVLAELAVKTWSL